MTSSQRLCLVCESAILPRSNNYVAKNCEACQRFFRRHWTQGVPPPCTNNCMVTGSNRNFCRYCRYQKCLAVGMKRKPTTNNAKANALVPLTNRQSNVVLTLVRDPVVYDGATIENDLKVFAQASTHLHELQSILVKTATLSCEANDPASIVVVALKQVMSTAQVSLSYVQFIQGNYSLKNDDAAYLLGELAVRLGTLYAALPNFGGYDCFGFVGKGKASLLHFFPEMEKGAEINSSLASTLGEWNPSFIICALLFGLLIFNEDVVSKPSLARIRWHLWKALQLQLSRECGGNASFVALERALFSKCIKLTNAASFACADAIIQSACRDPNIVAMMAQSSESQGALKAIMSNLSAKSPSGQEN